MKYLKKNMIKIGIDVSLSSTAIYVNDENEQYILCYLNDKKTDKWANELNKIKNVNIHRISTTNYNEGYSKNEIKKLLKYDEISEKVVNDLFTICGKRYCDIRFEGYSYTKDTNSLNDIITLTTLLRLKMINKLNCDLTIISPPSLKLETCKYCYGVTEIKRFHKKTGKELAPELKVVNPDGLSGGNFTKFDIYKAIIDKKLNTIILDWLLNNQNILTMKKIPSPVDDINDAFMLSKISIEL